MTRKCDACGRGVPPTQGVYAVNKDYHITCALKKLIVRSPGAARRLLLRLLSRSSR